MDNTIRQRIEKALAGKCTKNERKALARLLEQGAMEEFFDSETERFLKNDAPEGMAGLTPEKLSAIKAYIKDPEEKIIPLHRPGWNRVRIAAAAVVIITIASGLWLYSSDFLQKDFLAAHENSFTISGRNYVQIPDGSTALLDAGSTLTVLPNFGKGIREVELIGKAYFDVSHDPSKPFIVRTGQIVTTVLGTAFHIDTYSNKDQVTITVTQGKVAVGDGSKVYDQLTPDQQLTVNTTDFRCEKKTVNAEEVTSWKTNYLILDKVTMEKAAELISERFKVDVSIENEEVKQCVISVWFVNDENLDAVMTVLSKLRQATYTINGDKVTVNGGSGC